MKAVDGATFEIADGEIMGLAGESGCGKSTLGKSLIRMDTRMRYVDGRVELDGTELPIWDDARDEPLPVQGGLDHPAVRAERAQPDAADRHGWRASCCASRDVALDDGAARAQAPARPRRACRTTCCDRYPIELSGGMKQRVVMVLSSLLDPSLLIADEVTSALDVSTQRAVAELLVEFRDRGFVKSMIVITHDLSVLYQIADTILVMYAGKLAEKAPAGDDRRRAAAPVHAAAALVAARGRRALRRAAAARASRAGRRRCSTRRPAAASRARCPLAIDAVRASSRRSRRSSPARVRAAGRRPPDARARHLLQGLPGRRVRLAASCSPSATSASPSRPGEVVSLIGESGSGKSTIGKMILRLLRHDARRRSRSTASTSRRSRAGS